MKASGAGLLTTRGCAPATSVRSRRAGHANMIAAAGRIRYFLIQMNGELPADDRVAYVLARINSGLATEWSHIDELAGSLERLLNDARTLGQAHIPPARRADWDEAWEDLGATFLATRLMDTEARGRFHASNPARNPLQPWTEVLNYEREFNRELNVIRRIAAETIPASERSSWKEVLGAIELQIATLRAHAFTVRFQLELQHKYGTEKAGALTKEIAAHLPKAVGIADAETYAAEYSRAAQEFEQEKETFGGVWDILQALMLIQSKTPEERVRDKQPVRLSSPASTEQTGTEGLIR